MNHLLIGLIALAANMWSGFVAAETISRSTPVQPEFFGLVIHRAHLTTAWPMVPFGSWRLWDSYIKWSDVAQESGDFRFDVFDKQVALGVEHKKDLIYTFGQTPRWASAAPEENHAWGPGAGAMPRSLENWKRYVEAVVVRYKGKISTYEVWNEPKYADANGECKGAIFFCGTPEQLVELTRIASEVIKRIDPAAKLSSPGFTDGLRGVSRLDQYLSAGGIKYIDAVSFHLYAGVPEESWITIAGIRKALLKYGKSELPILNTEIGFLVQNEDGDVAAEKSIGGPFSKVYSPEQAGSLLARAMLVSASAGIDRFILYAWDSKRMGLIGSRSKNPNELSTAYSEIHSWLLNSRVSCDIVSVADGWSCKLTKGQRVATVRWAPTNKDVSPNRSPNRLTLSGGVVFSSDDGQAW